MWGFLRLSRDSTRRGYTRGAVRKIVVMMSVSLDGFFEGPNREIDWHHVDDEVHDHFNEVTTGMSAFLNGRVLYELMTAFWPDADKDPKNPRPVREFARIWRETPKIVFSKTLERADWNTTIVRELDSHAIERLKREPGGDMFLGGADLASAFARYGLVDEYRLYVHPVVLGHGRPLFAPSEDRVSLSLKESRTFGNGVVLLRYAVNP
jgi:dihydrofolate reductase